MNIYKLFQDKKARTANMRLGESQQPAGLADK